MANIFGILTAVVMVASIWIGYRNNTEFEKQKDLQETAERQLATAEDDEAALEEKLEKAAEEQERLESETEEVQANLEAVIASVDELATTNEEKQAETAENAEKLTASEEALAALPDPEALIPQITGLQNDVAQAKVDLANEEQVILDVGRQKLAVQSVLEEKKKENDLRSGGKSLPTLSTTIKSVYRNWGFVTLNGGNTQGVVLGSTLDVLRGGEVIAKLRVTAVEENRAAADIVLDALPEVTTLSSGDRVVAEVVLPQAAQ